MIDEKAERILYRLKAELLISINEFEYLMDLLKDTGKGSVLITDLTAVPRGYEAWFKSHNLPHGFELGKRSDGLNVAIPESKL